MYISMHWKCWQMRQEMLCRQLYVPGQRDIDPARPTWGQIEIFICRKLSDSCQDKEQFHFGSSWTISDWVRPRGEKYKKKENRMRSSRVTVICTRNFLLIMQSAICAFDHVNSSSLEAICCSGRRVLARSWPIRAIRLEHEFLLIFIIYALALSASWPTAGHLLLWPHVYLNINQKVAMAAQVNITHTPR